MSNRPPPHRSSVTRLNPAGADEERRAATPQALDVEPDLPSRMRSDQNITRVVRDPLAPPPPPHASNVPRPPAPRYNERSGVVPRPSDFEDFVRLDKNGRVMTGHGRVQELAALAAYATRMGDLIGDLLQFGRNVALEATMSDGALFVYRDGGGEIVGVKPHPRMSLRQLRTRLNL